ncbi:MAG: phenylacetate--CoA ligase [Saprospiraceae bacterium]|nr:phenylacetate--CoA ligase [Saprospiraceae bacterium]
MLFNAPIETLPLSKLRQLQNKRLRHQVAKVYEKVPFYRQKFDEIGLKPSDIKGVKDLHKLPFTKKSDLRDHYPFGLFAMPKEEIIRIHASSGTTGKPTIVGYSRNDIAIFTEVVARSLAAAGGEKGMTLQNAYGYGLFTGGLGLHYGAEKLGMTVVPVSGGMTDRQFLLMQDLQSDMICCTPSYAQTLAEELGKRGISKDFLHLKYAVLGAEPWAETIRQCVETGLGVSATNIYGLSEIIGPGVSQEDVEEKGTGSYVWEDHFFPEIVDKDTGEPLPEGEFGVLVFTTLTKEAMPLLRYWTNDITNIYYDHSEKRTHIKMGAIRGRSDDMLIIRGVNLFHTQIEDILKDIEALSANYQLIVSRTSAMDDVEVKVEIADTHKHLSEDGQQEVQGFFSKKIKENIGLSMKINILKTGDIPRSEGGKLSRIVDLRKIK